MGVGWGDRHGGDQERKEPRGGPRECFVEMAGLYREKLGDVKLSPGLERFRVAWPGGVTGTE